MTRYPAHPAAQLFPMMTAEQLDDLAADIAAHGLRVPIVLHEGRVLDGRNRQEACELAGVEPRFVPWAVDGNPVDWVVSQNLHRRHLTTSQKAMVAARLRAHWKEASLNLGSGKSAAHAAKAMNVSRAAVEHAAAVRGSGNQALIEAVDAGELAVSAAAKVAALTPAAQVEVLAAVEAAPTPAKKKKAAAASLKRAVVTIRRAGRTLAPVPGIELRLGDVRQVLDTLEPGSAGLIHADAPWPYRNAGANGAAANHYETPTLERIVLALEAAYRVAADDCYLLHWITCPQLADWFSMAAGLRLPWTFKSAGLWAKTGGIGSGFHWRGDGELLLLYTKGTPKPWCDATSNTHIGPRGAHSEKPEVWLRTLVETFSVAGELVLDLYAGRAPLARACRATGRAYLGVELDPNRRADALEALHGAQAAK